MPSEASDRPGLLLAYLRLLRAPNVFTALADVLMGVVLARQTFGPLDAGLCLLAASALIYTAGMVLNDVFDVEIDRRERPERPLPSGQIPLGWARWLGFEMLLAGVACAWLAGYLVPGAAAPWRGGVVALALAALVVLYNAWAKHTLAGPLALGGCRFLNVLLGVSAGAAAAGPGWALGFTAAEACVAAGIGLYITGVAWFARDEAEQSSSVTLGVGLAGMLAGVGLLAIFPWWMPAARGLRFEPTVIWPMLLLLMSVTIARRSLAAMADPRPEVVQAAVKQGLVTLVVLDAAVTLTAAGPNDMYWGIVVVALLAPMLLLGRWVYST